MKDVFKTCFPDDRKKEHVFLDNYGHISFSFEDNFSWSFNNKENGV